MSYHKLTIGPIYKHYEVCVWANLSTCSCQSSSSRLLLFISWWLGGGRGAFLSLALTLTWSWIAETQEWSFLSISASLLVTGNHCFLLTSGYRVQSGFLFFPTHSPWGNQVLMLVEYLEHKEDSYSSITGRWPLLCISVESWAPWCLSVADGFLVSVIWGRRSHSHPPMAADLCVEQEG